MNWKTPLLLGLLHTCAGWSPAYSQERDKWFIGFGLQPFGAMKINGSDSFDLERPIGVDFAIGATISPEFLLGFEMSGVVATDTFESPGFKSEDTLSVVLIGPTAIYFPQGQGFFVRGGLYQAGVSETLSINDKEAFSQSENGAGAQVGAGYAFWLGEKFNLLIDARYSYQKFSNRYFKSGYFWNVGMGCFWY